MKTISIDVCLEAYECFEGIANEYSLSVDELAAQLLSKGLQYRKESEKLKDNTNGK